MSRRQDYLKSGFTFTLIVISLLVCFSFVPSFRVGNAVIKRANILSDIVTFQDENLIPVSDMELLDTSFVADFKPVPEQELVDATGVGMDEAQALEVHEMENSYPIPVIDDPAIVQIVDYSPDQQMMAPLYYALAHEAESRPVRIAVLGDSFIEADIITADMREQLQLKYGGNGVGFVPFSTPLSKYRGTVTHNHEGWTNYNLIKRKSVPEEYKNWFFVSGMLSIPAENATTEYKGVQFRRRIEKANTASIFFVNRKNAVLNVTVNGSQKHTYTPDSGDEVRRIVINEPDISALKVNISNAAGFIGYGVVLEDSVGVSVHNYSVRSNSGLALLGTDYNIDRQFSDYMNYDMVILQYGLNAMSADVTNYTNYGKQLVKMINYIKQCFPQSAIVVMSVGDRSTMQNGTAVTMPAVKAMLKAQEEAAKECGVGFWNTYKAMGGDNSMPKFVERQWAAKDYTHIGYPGGKYIAEQFVRFISAAVESVRSQDAAGVLRLRDDLHGRLSPTSGVEEGVASDRNGFVLPGYSGERRVIRGDYSNQPSSEQVDGATDSIREDTTKSVDVERATPTGLSDTAAFSDEKVRRQPAVSVKGSVSGEVSTTERRATEVNADVDEVDTDTPAYESDRSDTESARRTDTVIN